MATRKKTVRRRKVDPGRIRSRLFSIVLEGEDRDAVAAARVLLAGQPDTGPGPDTDLLAELRDALGKGNL